MPINLSTYDLVVAIDSNIILEHQPLDQIAWKDLGKFENVLVVVVPQVSSEIDKFKRDGRLSNRARSFGRRLREFVSSGNPVELRASGPKVSLAFIRPGTVNWESLNLDSSAGDDRVVGQIWKLKDETGCNVKFISGDAYPVDLAKGLGIEADFANERWLLPPEGSSHEKKIKEYEAKLKLLQDRAAFVDVTLNFLPDPPEFCEVEPPHPEQLAALIESRSMMWQPPKTLTITQMMSPQREITKEDVEKYNRNLTNLANKLHVICSAIRRQFLVRINISNPGEIAAEELRVELFCSGVVFSKKLNYSEGWPPLQPAPKNDLFTHHISSRAAPSILDLEDLSYSVDQGEPSKLAILCQMFRQGRDATLLIFGTMKDDVGAEFCMVVNTSCKNGIGVKETILRAQVVRRVEKFAIAFDLEKEKVELIPEIASFVQERISKKDFSRLRIFGRK